MAPPFDVAARLAEGYSALDELQHYVRACAARGFTHPDLTLHAAQVGDWYGTEDGLDLAALDADVTVLRSAADAAGEAARTGRAQLGRLPHAWSGAGGTRCAEFLGRHCDTADGVAHAVGLAATAGARLREDLWRGVDAKVAATVEVAGRVGGRREAWLGAARAVLAGDTSEAVTAVVDGEIRSFVDDAIALDWLSAMRSAITAVQAAYRTLLDGLAGQQPVRFDIPGDLAPTPTPIPSPPPTAPVAPAAPAASAGIPAGAQLPPDLSLAELPELAAFPESALTAPAAAPAAVPAPAVPAAAPPAAPTAPALPDFAPLAGLPGRIAEAITGTPDPGLSVPEPAVPELDPPQLDSGDPVLGDGEGAGGPEDAEGPDEEDPDEEVVADEVEADEVEAEQVEAEQVEPDEVEAEPTAADCDCPQPPASDPAPVEPVPETPCEMAAAELPQVGE